MALLLNEDEVRKALEMRTLINALENALKKPFTMPPKIYVEIKDHNGDFRAMPCRQGDFVSLKWVSVYPRNPSKGLPTVQATLILNDARNARALALMPAAHLTAMRTGAMSGVATRRLARSDASTLAIIGAGTQAHTQAEAVCCVREIKELRVYDISPVARKRFVEEMRARLPCEAKGVSSCEEAVRGADIVCTCTPSRKPIVANDWISDGTHINAIGADAPGKQELEVALLKRGKVVVDDLAQAIHGGEPNVAIAMGLYSPKAIAATISDVVKGKQIRRSSSDVTIFCSTGLALQDLVAARVVYEAAQRSGAGKEIEL